MTTPEMAPRRNPAAAQSASRRGRWVAAAIGLALVVALGLGLRWWTHPQLFRSSGASFSAETVPVAEALLNIELPGTGGGEDVDEVVTIRDIDAHFTVNESQATASFAVCRYSDDIGRVGWVSGDLDSYCTEVTPVDEDTRFHYSPDSGEALVMTLTATRPGLAAVDTVTIDYARGGSRLWQRGEQTIDVPGELRAS